MAPAGSAGSAGRVASSAGHRLEATLGDGLHERGVIALGLVGVVVCERDDGLHELVAPAEVGADGDRLTRAGAPRPSAQPHSAPYPAIPSGVSISNATEPFMSRIWRTE